LSQAAAGKSSGKAAQAGACHSVCYNHSFLAQFPPEVGKDVVARQPPMWPWSKAAIKARLAEARALLARTGGRQASAKEP
jgi:hypothetical protein